MGSRSIVIRISLGDEAMDWQVERPELVSFNDTLEAMKQVPNLSSMVIVAFEYEDEDGDRITVKSDEEMTAMISFYLGMMTNGCDMLEPLLIYPKFGKSSGIRNIHGLTVQTTSGAADNAAAKTSGSGDMESAMEEDQGSSRKRSGDIREILACGCIGDTDIQYLNVLGRGNCGTVYKATHKPSGTMIAVKVIALDVSANAQKQIIAELEVLYRCDSPAIISFYGAFFVESRISMCTEWMDGGSLDKYGQVPEHILARVSVAVVKGLQYMWSLKIMHRDVKPSNMLVNTEGYVKLCDFGVSIQLAESIAKSFIGTNAYMAPERITGEKYGINSEVWSLGISLFEMATARFPYESVHRVGSKPIDLWKSIVEKNPPQLPPGVFSEEFVDFVSNCMKKDPNQRPAPHVLMKHPYLDRYNDNNARIVAQWVKAKLLTMGSQAANDA